MRRAGMAAAAAIMAVATLTACGGGDDFCDVGKDVNTADFEPGSDEAKDLMDEAVDKAPDEIKDDMETLRDVAGIDTSDPEAMEDAQDLAADAGPAAENVGNYVDENCD
ncbi:hypothetical protein [Solicola gregarius]|uniref:Uncharacterized protein n=1 Tax=Solicola gregarius TaxID=2908642 RepID=A0AA46YN95_9ACTN|nr:hypothetical protein [Solicola gregarius]UYM07256.1 hypothetical protein L0C25_09330 [Solicola gregarius]